MLRAVILEQGDGQQLPTELELATRYKVSRQTVRRAYQELVSEGVVNRVPGRGTFPAPRGQYVRSFGSLEDVLAQSEDTVMEVVEPLRATRSPQPGATESLGHGAIMELTMRRLHDGRPFAVTVLSVPTEVGRQMAKVPFVRRRGAQMATTILATLDRVLQERIMVARQTITIARIPHALGSLIGCSGGDPVLKIERLFLDAEGRAVELAVNYMNPDRYQYRMELRRTLS